MAADHYEELRLSTRADSAVVELAYKMLQRIEPLSEHSLERYRRDEAFRVLSNPQLRARYDEDGRGGTLGRGRRPLLRGSDATAAPPRKERPVQDRKKRGLFGLGRRREPEADAKDLRLLGLKDVLPMEREPAETEAVEALPSAEAALPLAELTFTAGPRSGLRVELDANVVPMGEGKAAATVWRHGERFMMRHNGRQVRIGGAAPNLSIVVLEDGDELAVGNDRAQFHILGPSANGQSA
jgi:curved DNA-binding protein CbpA